MLQASKLLNPNTVPPRRTPRLAGRDENPDRCRFHHGPCSISKSRAWLRGISAINQARGTICVSTYNEALGLHRTF